MDTLKYFSHEMISIVFSYDSSDISENLESSEAEDSKTNISSIFTRACERILNDVIEGGFLAVTIAATDLITTATAVFVSHCIDQCFHALYAN